MTNRVGIQLARISLNNRFPFICRLRIKVSSTTALRVKTIDGPQIISFRLFSKRSSSPTVKGENIASVDLCQQMLTMFGKV